MLEKQWCGLACWVDSVVVWRVGATVGNELRRAEREGHECVPEWEAASVKRVDDVPHYIC